MYAYNNSLTQNINLCDQENNIVKFNTDPVRENIDFNGSDTFTILHDGTYEATFSVNAVTNNSNGNLSYKLLKNNVVVPGSVYLTNSEQNVSNTVSGNVKFKAYVDDVVQLAGNSIFPSIISSSNSPFGSTTSLSGSITGPNIPVTVNSPPISTKVNSSVYVTVSNSGYALVTSITDGTNNYIKATEQTHFNGNGIVQIWYLDGVPESNSYILDINMMTRARDGKYTINVYNILGTENPSLDQIGTLNPITSTVVSNTITSTKKNDLAIMAYGRAIPFGIITTKFPNVLLDSTSMTADVYQMLEDVGTYDISVNVDGPVAQTAVSVSIKFADNQSLCDSPVNASIDLKLL